MTPRRLSTLPIGHSLGEGRYQILAKLGKGSYGSVYLAHDTRLGERQVAVKELLDPSPESRSLFEREAKLLASLNHPGLVRVSDFFTEGRSHYLVMDYIEGRDLREVVQAAVDAHQPLPIEQVLEWMTQVCEAVAYLHRRTPPIVHRDIKPANIRLSIEGRAILVDFGIAKVDPKATTIVMARAVSTGFSPPEQYEGGGGTDTRSDVYALGATLYCLLTLKRPPDGYERFLRHTPLVSPIKFNPAISPVLDEITLKAMALESVDRYQDARDMVNALKASTPPLVLPQPVAPVSHMGTGIRCWRCGYICRPTARFCPACGANVAATALWCPACGSVCRPASRYCSRCGAALDIGRLTPQLHDVHEHVAQGEHYARAGQWEQAIGQYEQALKVGLTDAAIYIGLADCYSQLGQSDDALAMLETGVRQHPQDATLHTQLGMAYLDAGKSLAGIQMLERACRLAPDDEALGLLFVKACFNADQLTQAERAAVDMQRQHPHQAELSFWRGMIDMKRGQSDHALQHFRTAVEQAPDQAMAHYFMGEILFSQKKWAEAAEAYQRCAEANPTDVDPIIKLGQCCLKLNRLTQAAAALHRALQIDPDNELAHTFAAQLPQ